MFSQIFEGTQILKENIDNFIKKNFKKISALMMASKMLSVIVLLSIVPLGTFKQSKNQAEINLRFDKSRPIAVAGKERQIEITSGISNLDLAQMPKSYQALAQADYGQGVERDPSYFRNLYIRAGNAYGVPWQLLEAVHYIETGASDSTSETSYAGAQGPMQFMPGTWRTYGVDGNGDGQSDAGNVEDAVYGAANLLAAGGAAEGNIDGALFNYNHAQWYVDKVKGVAQDAGM